MSWRVAESLKTLIAEVNTMAPNRSKASDGTIGDAAHATRSSDHNPWVKDGDVGVVTALDITDDPADGCDAGRIAERLRALGKAGDARVKYVIWNRQICSFIDNWRWRAYSGSNPHTRHVHLSVSSQKRHYDSRRAWGIRPEPEPIAPPRDPLEEIMATAADRAALAKELAPLLTPQIADAVVARLMPTLRTLTNRDEDGLYIRAAGTRAVYQIIGGVRVWVDLDDFEAVGRPEVQDLDPADELFKLRLVGARPPVGSE